MCQMGKCLKVVYLFLLLSLFSSVYSKVIYVSDGSRHLSEWQNRQYFFRSISSAVCKAQAGDEIWIAAGQYEEPQSIFIPKNVSVFGGFSGKEQALSQRNLKKNSTIIRGNTSIIIDGILDGVTTCDLSKTIVNNGVLRNSLILYSKSLAVLSSGDLINNIVAFGSDAGVAVQDTDIIHCTIYGNSSYGIKGTGTVKNSIIWKNGLGDVLNEGTLSVSYSCFSGGDPNEYEHNICGNPCFVNPSNSLDYSGFYLKNNSPCIDMGDPSLWVHSDCLGSERPGLDSKVCMGALESPDQFQVGDPLLPANRLYVSLNGDNSTGGSWTHGFHSIGQAVALLDVSDDDLTEIWVAEGVYYEADALTIPPRAVIYGGFSGGESKASDRTFDGKLSIIDGGGKDLQINNFGLIYNVDFSNIMSQENDGIRNDGLMKECRFYGNMVSGSNYNYTRVLFNGMSLVHCRIFQNQTESSCNYVYVFANFGAVVHSEIDHNQGYKIAGGLLNSGRIYNSLIHHNSLSAELSYGAGIWNYGNIEKCQIYSNGPAAMYGGVKNLGEIVQSRIYDNMATQEVGGIFNGCSYTSETDTPGIIENCLVYENKAPLHAEILNMKDFQILNSTIYNSSPELHVGNNSGIIKNSIMFGESESVPENTGIVFYSCFIGVGASGNGSISARPIFESIDGDPATWDFHLKNGSPGIDQAEIYDEISIDYDGNPRPGGDGFVCMGAFESPDDYYPSVDIPFVEKLQVFVSRSGDGSDGTSWDTAFRSIQEAISPPCGLDYNEMEIWIASGVYDEGFVLVVPENVSIYGGFSGTEQSFSDRDMATYKATVSGNFSHGAIINYGYVEGLLITKSDADSTAVVNFGTVSHCNISYNKSENYAVVNKAGCIVENSKIYSNYGQAIQNTGQILSCEVYSHYTAGTTVRNLGSGIIDKSFIHGNRGTQSSYSVSNSGLLSNSIVYGNGYQGEGLGVQNYGIIRNCTILDNMTRGIYNSGEVYNTISWGHDHDVSGDIQEKINYSCFREGGLGTGNIFKDPKIDHVGNYFFLSSDSPCIDKGSSELASERDFLDIPRLVGGNPDMGAFEYNDGLLFLSPLNQDSFVIPNQQDQFTVTGTVYDRFNQFSHVEYRFGQMEWQTAPGGKNWSFVFDNIAVGYHEIELRIIDSSQNACALQSIFLRRSDVTVDFSSDRSEGILPLSIQFLDQCQGVCSSYEWDFNGDGLADSTLASPVYDYAEPGLYSVSLKIVDQYGCEASGRKENYISVAPGDSPALSAEFVSSVFPQRICACQNYPVSLRVRNSGSQSWDAGGDISLGAVGDSDPLSSFLRLDIPHRVRYGEDVEFSFSVYGAVPGHYTSDWQMLKEGEAWFGAIFTQGLDVDSATGISVQTWELFR